MPVSGHNEVVVDLIVNDKHMVGRADLHQALQLLPAPDPPRHGYEGKQEWIVTTSGVVPAIFMLVNLLTEPGDGVIIQQPVYYPFSLAAKLSGRKLVNNALIRKEDTSVIMTSSAPYTAGIV